MGEDHTHDDYRCLQMRWTTLSLTGWEWVEGVAGMVCLFIEGL